MCVVILVSSPRWAAPWARTLAHQLRSSLDASFVLPCFTVCISSAPPCRSNTEEIVEQPKLLRPPNGATLREYQIVGLQVR